MKIYDEQLEECKINLQFQDYKNDTLENLSIYNSTQINIYKNHFSFCENNKCKTFVFSNYHLKKDLNGASVYVQKRSNRSHLVEAHYTENEVTFSKTAAVSRLMLLIKEKLNITYKLKTFKDGEPKEYLYWFNAVFSPKHHYSPTISAREVIFVVKAPGRIDKAYAFIKPFTLFVWFIIFLSLFLLTPIIKGIIKTGEKLTKKPTPNLLKIFWFLFRCILMQNESVSSFPGCAPKVVLILWIVATFILTSSYSGAILSYLSIPGTLPVISTYAQLARAIQKGTYTCGTVKTYSIRDIIMVKIVLSVKLQNNNSKLNFELLFLQL
ncbi:uncharacterized protein [Centruroides vittatus]|uniref:uncharacterized protein n=1 Tax=Centruroides vittatus TaxID=120091 RepID=UPI00350F7472